MWLPSSPHGRIRGWKIMIKIVQDPNNLGFGVAAERMNAIAEFPQRVKDISKPTKITMCMTWSFRSQWSFMVEKYVRLVILKAPSS